MGLSLHIDPNIGKSSTLVIITGPGTIKIQGEDENPMQRLTQIVSSFDADYLTIGKLYKFTLTPVGRGSDANQDFIGRLKSIGGNPPIGNVVFTIISGDIEGPYYVISNWIYFYEP
jgi:hypothetical protein